MRRRSLAVGFLAGPAFAQATPPQQQPVQVLSGGALEPAIEAVLHGWQAAGHAAVQVTYNTAPRIAARLAAGERPAVVLAPVPIIEGLRTAAPVMLGAVGVGIALRDGAPDPGIHDEASFRAALLAADAVVFNQASTGLYIDRLVARLGLTEAIAAKSVRFPDGDGVLRRIAAGSGREVAFAAMTEILLFRARGVTLAGPLPEGLQNRTAYAAALLAPEGAAFHAFLASAEARAALRGAGVD